MDMNRHSESAKAVLCSMNYIHMSPKACRSQEPHRIVDEMSDQGSKVGLLEPRDECVKTNHTGGTAVVWAFQLAEIVSVHPSKD